MKMKKFLSFALVLALLVGMLPSMSLTASAEGNTTEITPTNTSGTMMITLTIPKKAPEASNFDYTAPTGLTYDGSNKAATVTAKDVVTGMGDITVKYYSDASRTTEATPKNVGTYYVGVTVAEGDNYNAVTNVLYGDEWSFSISKADQSAPAAPTMASTSTNSITLNTITNGEYSKDGTTWQTSPIFTELTMNTEYTFYQRLAADANHNASPASASTSISTSNHTHSWSYEASGATITATCANSDGGHGTPLTSTLTINAPTLTTYGGTGSAEATITGSIDGVSNPTIVYKKGDETLASAPTDVGTYTASITLDGKTANVEYTIGKASASATAPTANTLTYNGADQSLVNAGTASGGTIQYAIGTASAATGSYGAAIPAGKNAGTYYVWYKAVGDANHSDSAAACVTVTIAKKAVTATVTVADKAFDDTTTATVSASVTSGVIDGDDITITGLAGTFASKNIGTGITVAIDSSKATIAGADNYNVTIPTSATGNITAKSIKDSNVTIYAIPDQNATGSEITPDPVIKYLGILLKKNTDYTLAYSNNTAEGTATVTVTGTGNYSDTRTANFTIIRAAYSGTLTVTKPSEYTYGNALGAAPTVSTTNGSGLSGEKVTVYYSTTPSGTGTAWSSSAKLNAGTYYVWAELAATDTHDKATSARVAFTVNKATPSAPSGVLAAAGYQNTYKVTLTIPSGKTYADYEYVVSTSSATPADNAWKSLPALTSGGFTPTEATTQNTTYYVFLRTKADSNNNASAAATTTLKTPAKVLLSYDANGSTASVPASVEYNSGTTATAAAAISRAGYSFVGWNETANGGGTAHAESSTFSITANTTLFAQWTPITYSVDYHENGGNACTDETGKAYNAEITLPTPTYAEHTFNGWATVSGGSPVYRGGQKVSGLTSVNGATVDLYAVWTENTYKITGEVKEERDGTTEQSIVAGVTVKIMRGSVEFATTATDDYGKYTFSGVPAGSYNIVATRTVDGKNQTMTALVEVKSDKTVETIVLPPSGINSALDVKGNSTPPVMVGGLDDVAKDEAEENKEVTVTMTVEKKDESTASDEIKQQIKEIKEAVAADTSTASGNTELEVLDVSVKKETKESSGGGSTTTETITETSQVVEIIVSFNMNGRFGFSLYRHHDGKAEPFQSRTSRFAKGSFADGYFFADKAAGLFYIYTSRFSTYAIGYEEGTSYAVTVNSGTGGGDYAEGATVTITADAAPSGKVFDKWTSSDVTFANANSATTTFTMPAKAVTVTATYKDAPTPTPTPTPYHPGSGGNGGYSPATYTPAITETHHGKVTVSPTNPTSGATVTITVKPDAGYEVDTVTVTDAGGKSVSVTKINDTTYTFTQPGSKMTVDVTFKAEQTAPTADVFAPYNDLNKTKWYADGVRYVLERGIMSGMGGGTFAPTGTTTRAQIAQILFNMEGKPAAAGALNYTDVNPTHWYVDAIRWADANGIMGGFGNGTFGPDVALTREQLVTIMYRYAKKKGIDVSVGEDTNILSYDDAFTVSDWAMEAMQWAVGSGLISGRTNTTLNPKDKATRAEIATIIMRYCEEIAK